MENNVTIWNQKMLTQKGRSFRSEDKRKGKERKEAPELTCACLRPPGRTHKPPHGVVPGVTVLFVEAVPSPWKPFIRECVISNKADTSNMFKIKAPLTCILTFQEQQPSPATPWLLYVVPADKWELNQEPLCSQIMFNFYSQNAYIPKIIWMVWRWVNLCGCCWVFDIPFPTYR